MYDILIKDGRVIDPAQGIDAVMDIAINQDRIALVSRNIPAGDGRKFIDAQGMIVAPGLIDMHCHVFDSVARNGVAVDTAGVRQGVTTVVDAGSAGQAVFAAFPKYIIPTARTSVFCFLHLGSLGLCLQPELREEAEIDTAAAGQVISSYPELIRGIKLRLVGDLVARNGLEIFKTAKKLAADFHLPVMVHIGDTACQVPASLTREFLPLMEKGDILSHVFTARQGSTMCPDGTFIPELGAALARGVIFDIAHGRYNMSYDVARKGIAQGIIPHVISSDLTSFSVPGPVYGLTATMSKLLALGLSLNQVITMTTINPARAINIADRKGSLKPGTDADVSILKMVPGKWRLPDAEKKILTATQLIMPEVTVKAGKVIQPKMAALPEQAD
ncbi:MAG: amidohydrolase/deacetylase family metallohydrolase [Chloroflexota bacterium]